MIIGKKLIDSFYALYALNCHQMRLLWLNIEGVDRCSTICRLLKLLFLHHFFLLTPPMLMSYLVMVKRYGFWPNLNKSILIENGFTMGRIDPSSIISGMITSVVKNCNSNFSNKYIDAKEINGQLYTAIWKYHRKNQNRILNNLLNDSWEKLSSFEKGMNNINDVAEPIENDIIKKLQKLIYSESFINSLE